MVRFTWGEKRIQERVIRPHQNLEIDEKKEIAKDRTNPETEKWFKMLTEIALRKRLQYVIRHRSIFEEQKCPLKPKNLNKNERKLSQYQGRKLKNKFLEDKNKLWDNAVRVHRTTDGDRFYYEFANENLEVLWNMYTDGKNYISKDDIKEVLFDAFVTTFRKSKKEANTSIPLHLDEWVYSAKVYLDQNMTGKVIYRDFERVNTRDFWLSIDFLTPVDEDSATDTLWMQIFDALENHGTLSAEIIYRAFERYNWEDEDFLYQPDIEHFLTDFMRATKKKWPSIDDEQINQFCDSIVVRGAILMRYLDKDETGRVTRKEFNEIGNAEFWEHVDYLTAVDASVGSEVGVEAYLADFSNELVCEMIETTYRNYVDYSRSKPEKLQIDKVIARPSFCKVKYVSPANTRPNSVCDDMWKDTPTDYLQSYLPLTPQKDRAISTSMSFLKEEDIDPRLVDMEKANIRDGENRSASGKLDISLNEKDEELLFVIDFGKGLEEHD